MEARPAAEGAAKAGSRVRWGLALLLLAVAAARVGAVFTSSVNWDELSLLARADDALETGVFHSQGRPGLAVLLALPFVRGCADEIASVRDARLLWLGFTAAYVTGFALLLARLQPDPRRRRGDMLLGLGLLALVPAFLEWSIQVRTDQIALAAGVWAGVALLASRRRPAFALVAGLLFGIGYLSTQKLYYVAALMGLLALGELVQAREWRPRRELARALACMAGYGLVVAGFGWLTGRLFQVPESAAAAEAVIAPERLQGTITSHFDFMRRTLGYSQYRAMLPTLGPHLVLLAGFAAASLAALRGQRLRAPTLWLAWSVLLLGCAVAAFHASAFFYFWMTLGMFPAVALVLAREPIEALLFAARPRLRRLALAGFWLLVALPALGSLRGLTADPQAVQRESLAFVHRNFAPEDTGFHPESGLFCQAGSQPFPTFFSQTIFRRYEHPSRADRIERMEQKFRDEPVKFIVESFRLRQFPDELQRFWAANYQPYRASVFVAGRHLAGSRGERKAFELLVPGSYRWLPYPEPHSLEIDGRRVAAGQVLALAPGRYTAHFVEDVPAGMLVLAMDELPQGGSAPFYRSP